MVDRLVRRRESARLLGFSLSTLTRLERAGVLKPYEILPGLRGYRESQLQEFVDARELAAAPNRSRQAKAIEASRVKVATPQATAAE